MNLKLGFALARIYGFTSAHAHGVYFPRHLMLLPSREYCKFVLRLAREREAGMFVVRPPSERAISNA